MTPSRKTKKGVAQCIEHFHVTSLPPCWRFSLPWEIRSIFMQNCFIGRRENPLYIIAGTRAVRTRVSQGFLVQSTFFNVDLMLGCILVQRTVWRFARNSESLLKTNSLCIAFIRPPCHQGATLWNSLPVNIKSADGQGNYKALLKKHDLESFKYLIN